MLRKLALLTLLFAAAARAAEVLDNAAVIRLVQAGLGVDVVQLKIEQSATHFDVSTQGLIELKAAGVPDAIIKTMLMNADAETPPTPPPVTKPASTDSLCSNVEYYTLGNNGWAWVPSSLCVTSADLTVDEENIPLNHVVAHCLAKGSVFDFGATSYRSERQEWWFADANGVRKFRGKTSEINAIAELIAHRNPSARHGSCGDRAIRSLFESRRR